METRIPWDIAELIVAQLNDSITEEEMIRLEQWINASEHHKGLYEKWRMGEGLEKYKQKSIEHVYQTHYENFCRYVAMKKRRRLAKYWGYAAAVMVISFICFWGVYEVEKKSGDEQFVEQIIPGQYKALLTLPGGRTMTLASGEKNMQVIDQTALVHEDTLIYEKQGELKNVEYHLLTIPKGGEYILKLSDGTRVWLNSETELRYPVRFRDSVRRVYLKGEAYFEVTRDTLHPFVVETNEQQVTVLGTSFAIRAYEDEQNIKTTLEQGRVRVEAYGQQRILVPGEQACLVKGRLEVEKVNTLEYTAWHKGIFVFVNQPLENILNTLARWYNIEVVYMQPDLKLTEFTGELQRYEDIQDFLDKIEMLEKVKFNIKGKVVTVSKY